MALARSGHQNLLVIGVVTDSAAGLPGELAARLGIEVVPLYLSVEGRSLRDGELPDLYERLEREPGSVTTSTPSPGDFEEAFARRPEEELVCVTLAASVSGVHGAASLAAGASGKRVEMIDSGSASMGEGWVALAAARAAAAGGSLEEVGAAARDAAGRTRLVATIDTMEHLRRSGRVGWIAALAATGLQLKPVFAMAGGLITPVARPRTRRRALERVAAEVVGDLEGGRARVAALHARAEDDARDLLDRVRGRVEIVEEHVVEFTAVMGAHTGPGVVGLAYHLEASA